MEELVRYLVSNLVDNVNQIEISTKDEGDKVCVITVTVAKDDVGKVIGRNGKIAGSIRTIVKSASAKTGKRYSQEAEWNPKRINTQFHTQTHDN